MTRLLFFFSFLGELSPGLSSKSCSPSARGGFVTPSSADAQKNIVWVGRKPRVLRQMIQFVTID